MIVLQDVDGVSYPFKEQYIKWMREHYGNELTEEFYKDYEHSNYTYLASYLLYKNNGISKEGLSVLKKKYPEYEKDTVRAIVRHTMRIFGDSHHFQEGVYREILELNSDLKKEGYKIIGVTARCCDKDKDFLYNDTRKKTAFWNENEKVNLDEIRYIKTEEKSNVLKNINEEILCFIEDDPNSLKGFLEKGVKCVLINKQNNQHDNLIKELKKEYPELLSVFKTHEEAVDYVKVVLMK